MISFPEEILLLAFDEQKGTLKELPTLALPYALSGAVLMDLALANRIDTDLKNLSLVDATPLGNSILDPVLAKIAEHPEAKPIEHWLEVFANDSQTIKTHSLDHLTATGVLAREEHRLLWLIPTRRYKTLDNQEQTEIRARLRELITTDQIPEPRDIVLLTLIKSCNLLGEILTTGEITHYQTRIDQLSRMDLIGQAVARSISEIQTSIMSSMLYLS
jgi:hypothetical protein